MGKDNLADRGKTGTVARDLDRAQEDSRVSNEVVSQASGPEESRMRGARHPGAVRPGRESGRGGGFALRVYKSGQGYYTRMGTAVGIGILTVAGAVFLHERLGRLAMDATYLLPVQYGVTAGFLVAMGVLAYWIAGTSRRTNDFFIATEGEMKSNDFFIATEGEMKKVRWSTRKEVVRSTKVVILTVILLGTFLFAWDILFMLFFNAIKVLKVSPGLERLFGSES